MFLSGIQSAKLFAHSISSMMLSKPSYWTMIIIASDWHLQEPKYSHDRNQAKTLTPNFVSLVKDCLWSFPLLIHSQLSTEIWQCWRHFLSRIIRYVLTLKNLLRAVSVHRVWLPFPSFQHFLKDWLHRKSSIGKPYCSIFDKWNVCLTIYLFINTFFYIQSFYC